MERRVESPDSSYVSSPERLPKRSGSPTPPLSDGMERPTYIKFLLSNAEAGSVIGKGGSTITDFQSQTGARIQLSRNQEFFPGTSDRIIMVSGAANEILKALELILLKLLSENHIGDGDDVGPRTKVRLVVPNSSCGALIGKGGATIRSFIEDSQAGIKVSPQDNGYYGLNDRLVTVTGSTEEQMRAIDSILCKLIEDPHYSQSMSAPFSYPVAYNTMNYGLNGAGGKFQYDKEDLSSVTIGVADEHIGLVVGRGGRNIVEIGQVSGAKIKISDRGDFLSGTSDRYGKNMGLVAGLMSLESWVWMVWIVCPSQESDDNRVGAFSSHGGVDDNGES